MTESAKKFLEQASKDEALKTELQAAMQKAQAEAAKKVAASHGFNLTDEDLKPDETMEALSEDELKAVAGGGICACVIAGGGTGSMRCACTGVGYGKGNDNYVCGCVMGGGGRD